MSALLSYLDRRFDRLFALLAEGTLRRRQRHEERASREV
jgi:hypothetical protein